MGLRAELRRQARAEKKNQVAAYHFTPEELHQHDQEIRRAFMERAEAEWKRVDRERDAHARQVVQEEWDRRKAFFESQSEEEQMQLILSLLLSCSCRVLIEKFHWKPVRNDRRKTRTEMFAEYLADEIGAITMDERKDIREYCEETERRYNVRFKFGEE